VELRRAAHAARPGTAPSRGMEFVNGHYKLTLLQKMPEEGLTQTAMLVASMCTSRAAFHLYLGEC